MPIWPPLAAAGLTMGLYLAGTTVEAQPFKQPYVGAAFGSFRVSADEVDGQSAAPGILAGIAVSRYVDIEFEALWPTDTFTRSYTGISVSFAPPGSTRQEIERLGVTTRFDKTRDVSVNVSVVAVIHPDAVGRITPALIAGVSNQRVRDRTATTPVSIPPGVDPQHPAVIAREEQSTRNIGGPTIGGQVSIRLTAQLYLVPDVRYNYGSIGDEINNALSTTIRVLWRF
jgi:hypothetical protein